MPHATCHMPHATCHMPHATCHMPHATRHMPQTTRRQDKTTGHGRYVMHRPQTSNSTKDDLSIWTWGTPSTLWTYSRVGTVACEVGALAVRAGVEQRTASLTESHSQSHGACYRTKAYRAHTVAIHTVHTVRDGADIPMHSSSNGNGNDRGNGHGDALASHRERDNRSSEVYTSCRISNHLLSSTGYEVQPLGLLGLVR
jgi:hypothetical protein